jgi:hypothetical protein
MFPGNHRVVRFPDRKTSRRLTVSTESLADYSSIQDAIDHASAGDTIVIEAGIYLESLIIDKPVHLVGPCDPRFADDEMDFSDEPSYALVIGTANVTIDWSAPGGSIRDVAISQASDAEEGTTLLRMTAGRLQLKRCVLSDGAQTAVACEAGEIDIERCHMRNVMTGVSVTEGFADLRRTHVEGLEVVAINVEPAGAVSLTDNCFEGRTVVVGELRAFEGNDLDVFFLCHPVSVSNNRVSSLVHLCGFQVIGDAAVGL